MINRYQARGGERRFNVACNFTPSCSEYMKQAIEHHGVLTGVKLGWRRLCRCNDRHCIERKQDPVPKVLDYE